jgi:replication factor C subunit 1
MEETTSSDYFAANGKSKPSKSTPIRMKPQSPPANGTLKSPTKAVSSSAHSTDQKSARMTSSKNYPEDEEDEKLAAAVMDEGNGADDIYAEDFKRNGRKGGDDYEEASDDDEIIPSKVKGSKFINEKPSNRSVTRPDLDSDEDIAMAEIPKYDRGADSSRKQATRTAPSSRKRKPKGSNEGDGDDFLDNEDDPPKKKARKTTTKSTPKPQGGSKKEERQESKEIQDIFNAIPTVRAPTPPTRDGATKKFDWRGGQNNTSTAPLAAGSKEIPVGEENCLAGLTFVFTGVLESLGREEGQSLVKRYGGRCTTAPSAKTSYVVLGNEAGPKKLETIAKLGLKTINEDGLFELIRRLPANGGDGKAAEKYAEKKAAEEEKIKKAAEEMERKEKDAAIEAAKAQKAAAKQMGTQPARPSRKVIDANDKLWVDKYAPDSINTVCGNKTLVEGLQRWLRMWHSNAKWDFKKAGADGKGIYRAAMLHGPPGVGKTTAAHLVAKLEGFDVVESNASDTRSKKLVESGLQGVLDTTSLLGYFAADGKKVDAAKRKLVLIMDEVDGMSAGDRGGVGALAAVAKKTNIPIIMICNDRRLPKMKPFDHVTADFPFRRPTSDMIRGRIMTICYREGIKISGQVIDQLIEGSHADIRQIINMISTVKLDQKNLDFNDSKAMAKAWEKHVVLKPWDIVSSILRPQLFAASSTATLNDKIELYFNDHEFSFLMLQENYLKTVPSAAAPYAGRDKEYNLKLLELAENAASSISDGDLVDRMIHGSQQQWSLMPTHAIFSFVRPASFVNGNFNERVNFSSWLGQNSTFGEYS